LGKREGFPDAKLRINRIKAAWPAVKFWRWGRMGVKGWNTRGKNHREFVRKVP